ncbi:type II/IV secretion system protein [candidate division KSB1 bacterium]|nr:type II/IV secretion system protein [candidate division KSB1 bacterium]
MKANSRIGEILVRRKIITPNMLQQALKLMQSSNGKSQMKLHEVLVDEFKIDRHLILREISDYYAFKEINLSEEQIDEARLNFIRGILHNFDAKIRDALIEANVVPFRRHKTNRSVLIFICPDPTNPKIHRLIHQLNIKQYEISYTRLEDIKELIQKVVQFKNEFLQLIEESGQSVQVIETEDTSIDEEALDAEINRSMLTNLIEGTLVEAVRQGASDIHVLPKEGNVTEFYFRIDGKLQLWHSIADIRPEAVAAVVKDRSINVDRFDRDIAQDGFIQRKVDNTDMRFRVSILPIIGSEANRKFESCVIRVLDDRKVITSLEKLGLQKQAFVDFKRAISEPQGMVILTGPTGSGKSTTLVAALNHVMDPSKNVLTVEEPVEYLIKEARQIKLSPKLNFDQALRSILRHDPDVVMVGEMRDTLSAKIGVTLANTGHLTFSTLHTNDAPSAIARLYMMGVELFLIANAINLVMAQRLVRTLCPHCKRQIKNINPQLPLSLGFTEEDIPNTAFFEAVGCDKCYGGFRGRIAIVEALRFTRNIKNIILQSNEKIDEEAIRQEAMRSNMLTLRDSGRERVRAGLTTIEEVLATTTSL